MLLSGSNCVNICPLGTTPVDNICAPCLPNCANCLNGGVSVCDKCDDGFALRGDFCVTCSIGEYLDKYNECQNCPLGCNVCSADGQTCTDCEVPFDLVGGACNPKNEAPTCSSAQFLNNRYECQNCEEGCLECTEIGECTNCDGSDLKLLDGVCIEKFPEICLAGSFKLEDGTCESCKTITDNCDDCSSESCFHCENGFDYSVDHEVCLPSCDVGEAYNFDTSACITCPTECKKCDSAGVCHACNRGFALDMDQNTCVACDGVDGWYMDTEDNNCKQCDSSCATCSSKNFCTSCDGDATLKLGSCEETEAPTRGSCDDGQFLFENECITCNSACETCNGRGENRCLSCGDGLQLSNGFCICESGTFENDLGGCSPCDDTGCDVCNGPGLGVKPSPRVTIQPENWTTL